MKLNAAIYREKSAGCTYTSHVIYLVQSNTIDGMAAGKLFVNYAESCSNTIFARAILMDLDGMTLLKNLQRQ